MTRPSEHREHSRFLVPRAGLRHTALIIIAMLVTAVLTATSASAYWSTTGSGAKNSTVGTLAAPTNVTVPGTSTGTVAVSWTASTGTPAPQGYYVTRTSGPTTVAACGSSATTLITATSCADTVTTSGTWTYTVVATYNSWTATSGASGSVVVTVAPNKLQFAQNPSASSSSNATLGTVVVQLQNSAGTNVTTSGVSVTLSLSGTGATLSGTLTGTSDSTGKITFSNLSVDKVGTYVLYANGTGYAQAQSTSFTITAGSAKTIAIVSGSAQTTGIGAPFANPLVVLVTDAAGNPVPNATVQFAAPSSGASANFTSSYTANATSASNGQATAPLSANVTTGSYSVTATSTGTNTVTFTLTNAIVAPAKVVFATAAVSGPVRTSPTLGPITVQVQDASGNAALAPTGGTTVTLSSSSSAGTFSRTSGGAVATTVVIPAGTSTATFYYADTVAGTPTISATAGSASGTQAETLTPGAVAKLQFGQQPTNVTAGSTITPAVTVQAFDAYGNLTSASVTIAIANNAGSGGLLGFGGVLNGTTTASTSGGTASFANLSITGWAGLIAFAPGIGYTLQATSGSISVVSAAFTVS